MVVKSIHLNEWANTLDSEGVMPYLLRKLVFATLKFENIIMADFAANEDIYSSGYDGTLKTTQENLFISSGLTVWEVGTNKDIKTKANNDYKKRCENGLGVNQKDATFVFVTPRSWPGKAKWIEEKKDEGVWKDVRCYDSSDLEQWLDIARGVDYWLAGHLKLTKGSIYVGQDFWSIWSQTDKYRFVPELLLGGREKEGIELKEKLLSGKGSITFLKGQTKEEALVYVLALIESLEIDLKDSLYAKVLVVTQPEDFNRLANERGQLVLISKIRPDDVELAKAKNNQHIVIIPTAIGQVIRENEIQLPIIPFQSFIDALKNMGIGYEKARQLSKNTARNISVLRRLLGISHAEPHWYKNLNRRDLMPMFLLSRFHDASEADKEIVAKMAGMQYEEYAQLLNGYLVLEETPLFHVDHTWRLVSRSDVWIYLAQEITEKDLKLFKEAALEVLAEPDPALELEPDKRYMAVIYKATPKYSGELRKGIAETLIMFAVSADEYGLNCGISGQTFADGIVRELLQGADVRKWKSLKSDLMRLSEASPSVMLRALETLIDSDGLKAFFEVENDVLMSRSDLPYLLWTLEQLAWMPEYLSRSSLLLCNLMEKGPKKYPTANTPLASLVAIYKSWYPQTLASIQIRIQALELLVKRHPDVAYELVRNLIFEIHDSASHTSRMEWRLFECFEEVNVTNRERWEMEEYVASKFIELTENNPYRLQVLVDKLDSLSNNNITIALSKMKENLPDKEEDRALVYHAFRKKIGRHRSFPDAPWSLPENVLSKMQKTAELYCPKNLLLQKGYLFEDGYPDFFEGRDAKGHEENRKFILSQRNIFMQEFLRIESLGKLFDYIKGIEYPMYAGETLAHQKLLESQEKQVYQLLKSDNEKSRQLVHQYILTKEFELGEEAMLEKFMEFKVKGWPAGVLVDFLLPLNPSLSLWKFVEELEDDEILQLYWQHRAQWVPNEEPIFRYAIDKFVLYKRSIAAINALGVEERLKAYSTSEILNLMNLITLHEVADAPNAVLHRWSIPKIFEELDKREDLDLDEGAKLEMKYLFSLNNINSQRKPQFLYESLRRQPELFHELLCIVYVPSNMPEQERKAMREKRSENEMESARAMHIILENLNKIPGVDATGDVDAKNLNSWIVKVRKLAKGSDRLESADGVIGRLLSTYPKGHRESWFPVEILEVLEEFNSRRMLELFEIGISNSRGATVRAANAGGDLERQEADFFDKIYQLTNVQFPKAATVFRRLRDQYLRYAKKEDESALREILDY